MTIISDRQSPVHTEPAVSRAAPAGDCDSTPAAASDRDAAAEFVHAAHRLTADLLYPNRIIYWIDLIVSATLGYSSLLVAIYYPDFWVRIAAAPVAVLAFYRAVMFIHELTHLRPRTVPGFWLAWNALVGVPLLLPSFMYEDVHRLHHSKMYYGTREDPEYLPLARTGWPIIIALLAGSLCAPLLLIIRFAVIAPIAAISPPVRRLMVEKLSSLMINPEFRRALPTRHVLRWIVLEAAGVIYIWTVLALTMAGIVPLYSFLITVAVGSGVSLVNQVRTVVAHRWESDGQRTDLVGQFLDSVTVPPPAVLPTLWAPVGLRYHGLHHLLPALPYHNLGVAHRRLMAEMGPATPYRRSLSRSGTETLHRIVAWPAR